MDKCRICLTYKKNLMSIYENYQSMSYADIMCLLAKVKITKNDGITDQICRRCRKSLAEAYDFKILIEQSDAAINEHSRVRKLNFNNLNDVKIDIKLENKHSLAKQDDMVQYFTKGVDEVLYNSTIIKKIEICNDNENREPVPVLEFLKSIKDDPDEENNLNFDNTSDMDSYKGDTDGDSDYVPADYFLKEKAPKARDKKKHKIKVKETSGKEKTDENSICIKPIYLKDLKLVYETNMNKCPKNTSNKYYLKHKEKSTRMCPYCGIMIMSLEKHLLQHTGERSYKCDECNKAFFTTQDLLTHKKRHSTVKDFKCDQCIAAFNSKNSLKSHQRMHSVEKKYVCDICSKAFKMPAALKRHRLMHNLASKNIMCDLCNMSFFTKHGLRHHLRVHTGERPYNCEICSQPYSYKHDFNRHCLKKHGVFFKRRSVNVMNDEVLKQERILMRDLMLRVNGILKDDKPLNPFDGPQAALAFEQAVKALQARLIPIDFHF